MLSMVRLSGSAVFQTLIGTTSYIGMVRILASFGSVAVAACTIVIRIIMFLRPAGVGTLERCRHARRPEPRRGQTGPGGDVGLARHGCTTWHSCR